MNIKMVLASTFIAFGLATTAFAGEGAGDPFPLSVSIGSNGQTYVSTLPITNGLPQGALDGTPSYLQAQSLNRWYAQQADHRFAKQQVQSHHQG